jgi:hypothetical protein
MWATYDYLSEGITRARLSHLSLAHQLWDALTQWESRLNLGCYERGAGVDARQNNRSCGGLQ